MVICFLNVVIYWIFLLVLICLTLNWCKLLCPLVLHFRYTLALAFLIMPTFKQLWEVYNISCSPTLTLLLLLINCLSICISQLLNTGLLSNIYYDIFVAHLIMDFNFTMTLPSLYTSFLMSIRQATKMNFPPLVLILSILATTLSPLRHSTTLLLIPLLK
ncbi:hypothetical protein Patl1_27717 [Pistacia atlantica]|uniref:Uncharacterized protein n=1 Tax=Pistacia atlantica TaxID=434234 RepID=A0ACC1BDH4_9ROSI|nr:hypothetical protein Patl1_27717 [Pistacia atlantica]